MPALVLSYSNLSKSLIGLSGLVFMILTSSYVVAFESKQSETSRDQRPNILLIVADDLGYSDLGSYGGEIDTRSLDLLAANGTRLTNFHSAPTCSPTRSMLMSGAHNHQAGLGAMAEWTADNQKDKPGYEGYLNDKVVALPKLLKDAGYYTFMAGKWHLGMEPHQGPHMRGFDDSFAMLPGGGNHFSQKGLGPKLPVVPYRDNGEVVTLPEDFYSTTFYTDKAISYIDKSVTSPSDQPFFGYVTYTAPHWPLQAPKQYIDKYRGKYNAGYADIKRDRLRKMIETGLINEDFIVHKGTGCYPSWNELSEQEQKEQARLMEIYAGMVDALDENIGRLIDHLKILGEYDNTLIVFISDNGADARPAEGIGGENEYLAQNYDNSFENYGTESSFVSYGGAWAEVGSTPFRSHKGLTTEGGIRVPAIIHLPGANHKGVIRDGFTSVMDILPTFLEYADTEHPGETYQGREVITIAGKSMLSYLEGKADAVHQDDLYGFSVHGRQGLQFNQWKILRLPEPHGDYIWELYNMETDPGETNNLAEKMPDKTK